MTGANGSSVITSLGRRQPAQHGRLEEVALVEWSRPLAAGEQLGPLCLASPTSAWYCPSPSFEHRPDHDAFVDYAPPEGIPGWGSAPRGNAHAAAVRGSLGV